MPAHPACPRAHLTRRMRPLRSVFTPVKRAVPCAATQPPAHPPTRPPHPRAQAWNRPSEPEVFYTNACAQKHTIAEYEDQIMPVVVGEWSLATDNCAMWLNGFNDNLPGYPMVQCDLVPCAEPYMGREQPGAPPPRWFNQRGPFGTGVSTPAFGMCPIDKSWPNDTDVMTNLGHKKLNAWSYAHRARARARARASSSGGARTPHALGGPRTARRVAWPNALLRCAPHPPRRARRPQVRARLVLLEFQKRARA